MVTAARPVAPLATAGTRRPRAAAVRHLGPNWYASVMGTAIVATAGAGLPGDLPGLRTFCLVVWVLSAVLLVTLLGARALHWTHHRDQARAHLLDPAAAPFYGCLAMALLAVGGATLVVGRDWIGTPAAVAVDAVLFGVGTVAALAAALAVPYLMVVHHRIRPDQATPVWLLPLVAPMVSAAVGPLLVPHLPPGQARETLLLGCFALFGLSLLATFVTLPVIFGRLLTGGRCRSPSPPRCSSSSARSASPRPPPASSPTPRRASYRRRTTRASPSWRCSTASPSWASHCCGSRWPPRWWHGPAAGAWGSP